MIETRLILVEGIPGSGKSTTAKYLHDQLQNTATECLHFDEFSPRHPIMMSLEYQLPEHISSPSLRAQTLANWMAFADSLQPGETPIHIIDSRLWQNTALFSYLGGESLETVMRDNNRIVTRINDWQPSLIYLAQDSVDTLVPDILANRNPVWGTHMISIVERTHWATERGLRGVQACAVLMSEWISLLEQLYSAFPYRKFRLENPQQDWHAAYCDIQAFLEYP